MLIPAIAGFFWDVYGRSYLFDFAHDDGITMVDNKPAYYPEFMYQRMMRQHVAPLLHSKGMCVTANKPVTLASCWGVDGIMSSEDVTQEENPGWIAAQSYLGLNRHVMILSRRGRARPGTALPSLPPLRHVLFRRRHHRSPRRELCPPSKLPTRRTWCKSIIPSLTACAARSGFFTRKPWNCRPTRREIFSA